jgi:hypothetical protein
VQPSLLLIYNAGCGASQHGQALDLTPIKSR